MKNNFEKLFTVEEALHYDAAALLPGLDAAVVLGNLDESFAWSLTRTDAMKLGCAVVSLVCYHGVVSSSSAVVKSLMCKKPKV